MAASPSTVNYYIGKGVVSFMKSGGTTFDDLGNAPLFEFSPQVTKLDHFSSRFGTKTKDLSVVTEKTATVRINLDEWTLDNLAKFLIGTQNVAVSVAPTGATHSSTLVDAITPTTSLVVGKTYNISGTGIVTGSTMVYNGAGAGTLSVAATATAAGVTLTITRGADIDIFAQSQVSGALRFTGANDIGERFQMDLPIVNFTPTGNLSMIGDAYGLIELSGEVLSDELGSFGQVLALN